MIRTSSFPIWCGTSITFCYKNATNSGNALTINKMWVIESFTGRLLLKELIDRLVDIWYIF